MQELDIFNNTPRPVVCRNLQESHLRQNDFGWFTFSHLLEKNKTYHLNHIVVHSSNSEVYLDEFDAFYHFDLAFKVCQKLFAFSNQIFVTSHNTYLMTNDLLRPDCNFIINKNKIKPLCLCTDKELRFGNSIEKMYRGNAFEV